MSEELKKETVKKEDCRYLIYYSWKKNATTPETEKGEIKCRN